MNYLSLSFWLCNQNFARIAYLTMRSTCPSHYRFLTLIILIIFGAILSLTLKEEHRLRVFENRVLRRIFGPQEG
jgi:hypothetical protein